MNNSNIKKYKLAIIAPVPFYYHVPLYQILAKSKEIDLTVYYCSDETVHGIDVEKMYCTKNRLADENSILKGYKHKFLKNYSFHPTFISWPFGLINFGICKEIKKEGYDAVVLQSWTNLTWWLAFLACLRYNVPIFLTTDSNISTERLNSGWKMGFKKIVLGKLFFRKTAIFLTGGKANEDYYEYYGVSRDKMVRLPHWWGFEKIIDSSKLLKSKRESARNSLEIKKDEIVLLFVGRLSSEKGILNLLKAYNQVSSENKKLIIVGDGPQRAEIEKFISDFKIKNVFLKGFQNRSNILDFYNVGDIFILPSKKEPWGMVVNEAMCFSLPIIVSDKVGAGVDLVKNNYNGYIFPYDNYKKLVDCINKLINLNAQQRQILGNRSFEMINNWVNASNPEQQIIKAIKLVK